MSGKVDYQVIIIGGGPAGISTSLVLTARGISNCIVEAQTNPVMKPGESVPPNAKPILSTLGLSHLVADGKHSSCYGIQSCWGSPEMDQRAFVKNAYGTGYLLDRCHFERQLRAHVKHTGGQLYAGFKLRKLTSAADHSVVEIFSKEQVHTLRAHFVVDATGRKASVCQQMGIPKTPLDDQFAITFKTTRIQSPQEITIEACEQGWWYHAPQKNGELIGMFFTHKNRLPPKAGLPAFLRRCLAETLHTCRVLSLGEEVMATVKVVAAGTSRLRQPHGTNWLAVGDAAYSYDPISSYGITAALSSGFYGGHALASQLQGEPDALTAYRYAMEQAFNLFLHRCASHYLSEQRWPRSPYWQEQHAWGREVLKHAHPGAAVAST